MSSRLHLIVALLAGTLVACGGATARTKTKGPTVAKTGGIHGVVADAVSGAPLSFVTVIAQADNSKQTYSHTTDGNGHFALKDMPAGAYQVLVTYGPHTSRQTGIPVKLTSSTHIHLSLDMRVTQPVIVAYKPTRAVPKPAQRAVTNTKSGIIEGMVRSAKTKELLPGTVVGATSSVMTEPRLAVVDSTGRYRLLGLPPGTYVLSIYYTVIERGNVEVRRGGVEVNRGKATVIDLLLDTEKQ